MCDDIQRFLAVGPARAHVTHDGDEVVKFLHSGLIVDRRVPFRSIGRHAVSLAEHPHEIDTSIQRRFMTIRVAHSRPFFPGLCPIISLFGVRFSIDGVALAMDAPPDAPRPRGEG